MKQAFFLVFLPLLAFQTALFGQANNAKSAPQLEVRVQASPNGATSPQANGARSQGQENFETIIVEGPTKEVERTLSILKPDAVQNRHIGDILSRFEDKGLRIVGMKMIKLNKEQASKFYAVHHDKPFFADLVNFMSSGPVVILALEGDQAIAKNRELMGATDPKKAAPDTIRSDFSKSTTQNTVHGSDSPETAREEINFFFKPDELFISNTKQ